MDAGDSLAVMSDGPLRVGELAARLEVSTHTLRAWESRYGLFRPGRSRGGYRLYDALDVRRAEAMRERITTGARACEAARLVLRRLPHGPAPQDPPGAGAAAEPGVPAGQLQQWRSALVQGCAALDEPRLLSVLAESSTLLGTDDYVEEIVVPLLRLVTVVRDDGGTFNVAHAHFAGNLVRGALLARDRRALPRGAPRLWLACPSRELHDLGLMAFGLVAAEHGWAVRFFGANTPLGSLVDLARREPPSAVVVSATRPGPLRAAAAEVAALADVAPTAVGGPAARRTASLGIDVPALNGDIVGEARSLRTSLRLPLPA